MQTRYVTLAVLLLFSVLPHAMRANEPIVEEPTPATITPRFLQFDDEYHYYDLALLGAESALSNMKFSLDRVAEDCEHTRRLFATGVTNSTELNACEHQVEQRQSEIELHKLFVASLERGKAIANLNRTSESGKPVSMADLAMQYVSKWKDETTKASIKTKMAKRQLGMETDALARNDRMRKRGYITHTEYEAGRLNYQRVRNEVDTAVQREEKLKSLLTRSEKNLENIKKSEAVETGHGKAPAAKLL